MYEYGAPPLRGRRRAQRHRREGRVGRVRSGSGENGTGGAIVGVCGSRRGGRSLVVRRRVQRVAAALSARGRHVRKPRGVLLLVIVFSSCVVSNHPNVSRPIPMEEQAGQHGQIQ